MLSSVFLLLFACTCCLVFQQGKADFRCGTPGCKGDVAAIGTPDNFDYNPAKNNLHHDLTGANILIIGDSRGSGRATVLRMIEVVGPTGKVLGGSRTPVSGLEQKLQDLHNASGSTYRHFVFDMGKTPPYEYFKDTSRDRTEVVEPGATLGDDYQNLVDEVESFLGGRIDHIYVNAGVAAVGPIADVPWAHFAARRESDLADHAVWWVLKPYLSEDYGTFVTASTLDTRIHIDVGVAGYHSSKTYRTLWATDMHGTTRDHPRWKKWRFVSLEPSYVNGTISLPAHTIVPPEDAFECPNTVNRTIFLSQLLTRRQEIVPVAPSEVADVVWEIFARKDVGKPFKDKAGDPIPTRISVWPSRDRVRGIGAIGPIIGEGGPIDLDTLYRNTPYSTIEALPFSDLAFGLIAVRCQDQTVDQLWKEFGITPQSVDEASQVYDKDSESGTILGNAFYDVYKRDQQAALDWFSSKGIIDREDYEEKLQKVGLSSEKVDELAFDASSFLFPTSLVAAQNINDRLRKIGLASEAPEDTTPPEQLEMFANNPNAKFFPGLQDLKYAKQEPLVAAEPVKGQWNPYEPDGKGDRAGNWKTISAPSGLRSFADRLKGEDEEWVYEENQIENPNLVKLNKIIPGPPLF
uniref:Uncharacterized protein n=1 Tax=Chromera velia CCMP2878 TaxID=1169474 RepID=A0A0G4H239_9ALVE|mmetsp:Transcript_36287/g.71383  ORF Transcript_36287/g.71383 Transcript_36287/m.71383 type:complete len:633 (+) Transcript_36287:76-1974(+)|eukprot:Cvel_5579.t1-p1 / transcript=Cvel_5579.t1 / gene=Cvel_5579 / organism=Chromera_velia_CCMP2878 / gene_product=hypothetical protein / transcript_product=hypothetical protein / location=Cvel_scaffold262:45492-50054(+) / protein_length=632 / sequence_SO=supercontig / SO=protein_coding / is_pseudo=false